MGKVFQLMILAAALTFFSVLAAAQDLGSSNKLFGGDKKVAAKTAKKPVAKRRSKRLKRSTPIAKHAAKPGHKPVASAHTPVRIAPRTPEKVTKDQGLKTPAASDKVAKEAYDKLIAEGNAARDEREYSAAESAYKRAESAMPKDPRSSIGLGSLYIDTLRWEDAEKAYRTVLQLDPKNTIAYVALSFVLTQPVASPNLSDRYDEAEKLARKSLELRADNALAYDQMGVALERRGLIGAETEGDYRRAIQIEPAFAPSYAHLGRLMRRRGKAAEAATADSDALARANDVPAMILVADAMQSEQRFDDSIPLLKRALEHDPRNPSALVMVSRALIATGNYDEAESFLKKSTEVSPASFVGFSLLGTLYSRRGNLEKAENSLLQASRFAGAYEKRELAAQFEALGDEYNRTGKAPAAERVYRKALSLDATRGTLAAKIGRFHH